MGDCVAEHAEDGEGCREGDGEGAGQGEGARGQEEKEEGARELLQVSGKVGTLELYILLAACLKCSQNREYNPQAGPSARGLCYVDISSVSH